MNYSTGGVRAAPFAALKQQVATRVAQKPRTKLSLFQDAPLGAWFRLFTLVRHTKELTERLQELPPGDSRWLNVKSFVHGAQVELEETHTGIIFVKTGHQHGIDLLGRYTRWKDTQRVDGRCSMIKRYDIIPGQRAIVLWVRGPTGVYTQDKQYIPANYEVNV